MGEATTSTADERRERVTRAVEAWVRQLIDMTGNNQLLYYRTLRAGTLELSAADPVALSTLLSDRTVRLSELFRSSVEAPTSFEDALKRARTVHGKALTHFEERGIETLFLAHGMASWTTTTTKSTPAAPVLLRPLKLDPRGAAAPDFDVSLHGDWDVNQTLLHLLSTDFRTTVDAEALLELLDGQDGAAGIDPDQLFEQLEKEASSVPGFGVTPRVVAGTFAYTKLPMVKDLQNNVEQLIEHDLIAAIAGDQGARQLVADLRASSVEPSQPDVTPPSDEFLILDADASQNFAINAALAGEPLIVQGPPGTGKSQTIANLITSMTARGKRVLFVAEKRAAIEAVTKRLSAAGLGDMVMDLHGGVSSKKQLAAELSQTLQQLGQVPHLPLDDLEHNLVRARTALSEHAAAMHEERAPWGRSMFSINERLLDLGAAYATDLRFTGSRLEAIDADGFRQLRSDLQEWAGLAEPTWSGRSPWGAAPVTTEAEARQALDLADELLHDQIPAARTQLDRALQETGLPAPASVAQWQRTLALLATISAVLAVARPDVFDLDEATIDALAPGGQSWWDRMIAQLFNGDYRRAKAAVRDVWIGADKPNGPTCCDLGRTVREARFEWAGMGGTGRPRAPEQVEDVEASYAELTEQLAALGAYLVTRDLSERPHHELASDVTTLVADQQTLFRLPRVHELEQRLSASGLDGVLEGVRRGELESGELAEVFEHAWLSSMQTHLSARDPRLANFDGHLQHQYVAQFRDADRQHLDYTPARVRRAIAEQAVARQDQHPQQSGLVAAQARRKRSHMPLRRLFEQAPDVMTALRPCWAMSPLVVSQTLPAAQVFDLVIFDEASQVLPADAVPALLRAPQAVVAGDRRQLPPTTFFGGNVDDEDDEDDDGTALTTGYESILDVLDALLRSRTLQWHYRSRDERLIAFSNYNVYDGSLTTFPGTTIASCIEHVLIPHRPGVKVDTRSSDAEVDRVVDLMVEHARNRPDESLGTIAMGQHHASRIEAALRSRLQNEQDPELNAFFDEAKDERAFVKNLERVQGDERDAIILAVGYGKEADGRLPYRFGPLTHQGGERRLNVAVTRARTRMTLVSAFSHTDMDPSRSSAEGVELLRRYLKYAETGGTELDGADDQMPLNAFEVDVKYRLEQAGMTVIPQYGSSGFRIDFAVPHPDRPGEMVLAIEADGASYHSSATARDRDRLRQQILEQLGWRFCRIWSTDWFNDPQDQVERVLAAYERAISAAEEHPTSDLSETVGETEWEFNPPERSAARPRLIPGQPITAYSHSELVALAAWIRSDTLLRTEEQMVEEMMRELGFSRRGKRIIDAITRAVRA